METNFDIIIVGGGIVGLATALKLTIQHPHKKVLVLEKEKEVAAHQTGHNSGVIHSGIYYKPGTYKAKNCVAGRRELVQFAKDHKIQHDICGKIIVATHESELAHMNKVYQNGIANGVENIEIIDSKRIKEIEPHCQGISGLWVGCTGIIDYVDVAKKYVELIESKNRRGLADRIGLVECDFREIPGQYDKLLSIGTLEHAGRDQLPEVIRAHAAALKPGGLGVIHFIGHVGEFDTEFYIRKYIFPGGWIPSLARAIEEMERCGLEVLDIENLRRHYGLTLDCWATRFDSSWDTIHALDPVRFDETFRRTWRTYLWSCAEMFRSQNSRTHLFQVTVAKGNVGRNYPMRRDFLYSHPA